MAKNNYKVLFFSYVSGNVNDGCAGLDAVYVKLESFTGRFHLISEEDYFNKLGLYDENKLVFTQIHPQ